MAIYTIDVQYQDEQPIRVGKPGRVWETHERAFKAASMLFTEMVIDAPSANMGGKTVAKIVVRRDGLEDIYEFVNHLGM